MVVLFIHLIIFAFGQVNSVCSRIEFISLLFATLLPATHDEIIATMIANEPYAFQFRSNCTCAQKPANRIYRRIIIIEQSNNSTAITMI